jgi:hypothetical protein
LFGETLPDETATRRFQPDGVDTAAVLAMSEAARRMLPPDRHGLLPMAGVFVAREVAKQYGAKGFLHIYAGANKGQSVLLGRKTITIGRSLVNVIALTDSGASARHCEVRPVSAGYRICDVGSRNGTFLDDQRVEDKMLAARRQDRPRRDHLHLRRSALTRLGTFARAEPGSIAAGWATTCGPGRRCASARPPPGGGRAPRRPRGGARRRRAHVTGRGLHELSARYDAIVVGAGLVGSWAAKGRGERYHARSGRASCGRLGRGPTKGATSNPAAEK